MLLDKYLKETELFFSVISGCGYYRWTGRMVQDPLSGDGGKTACPLFINAKTGESFFARRVSGFGFQTGQKELIYFYTSQINSPPQRREILWPSDLIRLEGQLPFSCDTLVERCYMTGGRSCDNSGTKEEGTLALLFPYGEFPALEDGERYLSSAGSLDWRNEKVQSLLCHIAEAFEHLNRRRYLYLDIHMKRLFFKQDGSLFFDFSNLIFTDFSSAGLSMGKLLNNKKVLPGAYPVEFAEPAVVSGKQEILDIDSQNYSLAALFFYLMFGRYPYEGKLMDGYSDQNEREHYEKFRDYHKMPVFIFDPLDNSNRLGDFAEEQAVIELWNELPGELRTLFLKTLIQSNATREVKVGNPSPAQWLNCFHRLGWNKNSAKIGGGSGVTEDEYE